MGIPLSALQPNNLFQHVKTGLSIHEVAVKIFLSAMAKDGNGAT